jgi:excisionase family DNA binding protein
MSNMRLKADESSDHDSAVEIDGFEIFETESHSDNLLTSYYQAGNNPSQGLTIKEACAFLKVSDSTLRGRIKRGEISATKVKTTTGEQWRVFPGGLVTGSYQPVNTLVTTPATPSQDNELLALLSAKTERLEAAMMEIGSLRAQLQASQEKTQLLEDRSRVPWWRRFWEALKS